MSCCHLLFSEYLSAANTNIGTLHVLKPRVEDQGKTLGDVPQADHHRLECIVETNFLCLKF